MYAWFRVTFAVVQMGSGLVRFACGTKRMTRAAVFWAIAGRNRGAAIAPARTERRFTALAYLGSVQLSQNASAHVLNGRFSRTRGNADPFACTPFLVTRAPAAGIRIVHTPYGRAS